MTNIIDEFVALVRWQVDAAQLDGMTTKARELRDTVVGIGQAISGVGLAFSAGLTLPILAMGKASLDAASDIENMQTSFEVMLGSQEKAIELTKELQEIGASTPYESGDLADATRAFVAQNMEVGDAIPLMLRLGDIALGNRDKFMSMSYAVAKMSSAGKLNGEILETLIGAGFSPLQTIANTTGKSVAELRKEMENGAISAKMVIDAITTETSKGGRFFEGAIKGSKTFSGVLSTLRDNATQLLATFGGDLMEVGKIFVNWLNTFLVWGKTVAEIFLKLPQPIRLAVYALLAMAAAIGPLMLALGPVVMTLGQIAFALWQVTASAAAAGTSLGVYLSTQARIAAASFRALAKAIWAAVAPLLPFIAAGIAIIAIVAAWGMAIAVLTDDFRTWQAGGESALSSLWEWFERLKNNAVKFWETIKPGLVILWGVLLAIGRVINLVVVKAWEEMKKAAASFMESGIVQFFTGLIDDLKTIASFVGEMLGPAFTALGENIKTVFGGAIELLDKIMGFEPVKAFLDTLKNISDFGYTGEWNGANAGAAAAANQSRYVMAAAGGSSTYNAGGLSFSFGGTNASSSEIKAATTAGLVDGFRMVESNNGGRK